MNRFYLARMAWPQLDESDVSRLANCARRIAAAHPRGLPYARKDGFRGSLVEDMVVVERIVLKGFGFTRAMRSAIYREDRSDRRGFWRYFDASAEGLRTARRVVNDEADVAIAAE